MFITPYREDLKQVVILNPKGGCGKTTLATNLASAYALRGKAPLLVDNDPIGYSARWLEKRSAHCRPIHGVGDDAASGRSRFRWASPVPADTDLAIIDTPAALDRQEITRLTRNADCILVPILPSAFDVHFATRFVADLLLSTQFEKPVGVVANRTRQNTHGLALLMRTLDTLEVPTVAVLRNSQNYVHAADLGVGIHEMPPHRVRQDRVQFDRIMDWLDTLLERSWAPGSAFGRGAGPVAAAAG